MQTNDLGHPVCPTIAEMAVNRIPNHFPQFFQSFSFGRDGMPKRHSHEATINLIFPHLENNFFHKRKFAHEKPFG